MGIESLVERRFVDAVPVVAEAPEPVTSPLLENVAAAIAAAKVAARDVIIEA